MNEDVTAALRVAKKLQSTAPRAPRLTFAERQLAGAILERVAKRASRAPSTPVEKEMAWEDIAITLAVYLDGLPGGVL